MGFTPAAAFQWARAAATSIPGWVAISHKPKAWMPRRSIDGEPPIGAAWSVRHQLGRPGASGERSERLRAQPEALALFCYRIKQTVGAYAATLGGLDELVFSGGIAKNPLPFGSASARASISLALPSTRRATMPGPLSYRRQCRGVTVRIIPTDEEAVIAAAIATLLHQKDSES